MTGRVVAVRLRLSVSIAASSTNSFRAARFRELEKSVRASKSMRKLCFRMGRSAPTWCAASGPPIGKAARALEARAARVGPEGVAGLPDLDRDEHLGLAALNQ